MRFQKFNNHIRLRPEALASRIELVRLHPANSMPSGAYVPPSLVKDIGSFKAKLEKNKDTDGNSTLSSIMSGPGKNTAFLPMAFPEGSPMHPAYGAGHATVAGACVTILKAFFDTSAVLAETSVKNKKTGVITKEIEFKRYSPGDKSENIPEDKAIAFRASTPKPSNGEGVLASTLDPHTPGQFLTLEGELNKLAANIAIGRNMAGVHYFSDYYNSLRLGEKIAIGILEEQALTYLTDPFVLSVPTFDGSIVRIGRR